MFDIRGRKFEKNRISFYENIIYGLENYSSSSDEINALLDKFYYKIMNVKSDEKVFAKIDNLNLKKDIKKGKSVIREVYIGDVMIATIFKFLHEAVVFNIKDEISELICEIYYKIDKLVYPYQENNDSDADYKYYVEIIYEEDR